MCVTNLLLVNDNGGFSGGQVLLVREKKMFHQQFYHSFIILLITIITPRNDGMHPPPDHPQSNLLSYIASPTPAYFWLVVAWASVSWRPLEPKVCYCLFHFLPSNCHPI
jgi:hypothetical protein